MVPGLAYTAREISTGLVTPQDVITTRRPCPRPSCPSASIYTFPARQEVGFLQSGTLLLLAVLLVIRTPCYCCQIRRSSESEPDGEHRRCDAQGYQRRVGKSNFQSAKQCGDSRQRIVMLRDRTLPSSTPRSIVSGIFQMMSLST
ncbi:hypothetical protein J3R82DRAFT_7107 [Butyriboletus roseoflavus]|nr:hypothetical protein J3R82DRAFT_7107 [Butyriboletus roseoflavus]